MRDYIIYTDISADIDADFVKENDIHYIPMEYMLGEETILCDRPATNEEMAHFYNELRNKVPTQTSQITPSHYMDVFEPVIKEGTGVLYMSLSSGLSKTYESALLAARDLKEDYPDAQIEIVDSLSATGGMGLLAEAAAINKKNGMTVEENASWLREHASNIHHWFKVQDLMYLMRGGRVSAATAIMGTALNIKPVLNINSTGHLDTIDKKRGNKLAMRALIDRFESHYDPKEGTTVYISCADILDDAESVKAELLEAHPELKIRVTQLSPIIGAHTGPDMMAIIHWGVKRDY